MVDNTLVDAAPASTEAIVTGRERRPSPNVAPTVLRHVIAWVLLVIVLYPIAWLVSSSFKSDSEIGGLSFLPESPTINNYVEALKGIGGIAASQFFLNSLILAILSVVGILLSASITAYAFARMRFRGRNVFFTIMIATMLLPVHVTIIPQYIVFQQLGLIDTYFPLLIGKFLAVETFFVFLMVQFIRGIPRELDEAARIDGCGHVGIFTRVVLPLMKPALVTSSIFAFIWSWNDFFGPLIFITSPEKYPLPVALRLYVDQMGQSTYGTLMAMSVLALIPVVLFFLIFQRFLVQGVATQGLKG